MVSPLNYQDKKKMLFDCLASAEKSIKGTVLEQKESQSDNRETRVSSKVVSRRFQGKESIFKRPAAPIGKCLKPRRAPDYQVINIIISPLLHPYIAFHFHINQQII